MNADFNFVTNQPEMVKAACIAYRDFPTVVNEVPESGVTYDNNLAEYARMDNQMQSAQKAIGGSSDSAQLALSYYFDRTYHGIYDEETQQLYDNTVILAVLAQLAIDGCKKVFDVDVNEDIKRIRSMKCMDRELDYPKFMKYTHKIPTTKNGKERPYEDIKKEREKIKKRVDESIVCPMNWLQDCLNKIQGSSKSYMTENTEFLVSKPDGKPYAKQMTKIRKAVEKYDAFTRQYMISQDYFDYDEELKNKTQEIIDYIYGLKLSQSTVYRLVETSLGYEGRTHTNNKYLNATKYASKMLSVIYKTNKEKLLNCFIHKAFS